MSIAVSLHYLWTRYVFTYDGKKYECSFGVRGINIPLIVKVEDGVDSRE